MILETGKHNKPQNQPRSQCARTLIRLVLVMALLVVAAFAVGSQLLDLSAVHEPYQNVQVSPALKEIKTAIDEFDVDNGFYPKNLQDLLQRPPDAKRWHGPYMDSMPVDPWGGVYLYSYPGKHNLAGFDLWSAGPDGKPGTRDDIGNW